MIHGESVLLDIFYALRLPPSSSPSLALVADLPDGQLAAIAAVQTFPNRILILDGDPIPPDEFLGS